MAISDDKKYKIQNQQTSASKMLRNIDLEISKDHNSKNVPGETIFVPESFENKLLAPLGPEILRNLHPPFFYTKKASFVRDRLDLFNQRERL